MEATCIRTGGTTFKISRNAVTEQVTAFFCFFWGKTVVRYSLCL